jgi:hypothetical protein
MTDKQLEEYKQDIQMELDCLLSKHNKESRDIYVWQNIVPKMDDKLIDEILKLHKIDPSYWRHLFISLVEKEAEDRSERIVLGKI